MSEKVQVHLAPEVREELEALCRKQSVSAAKVRRARILLLSDDDHPEGRRPDWQIAEIVGIGEKTVQRVRQKFVREGLSHSIERKQRSTPGTTPKFDGRAEAQLVALCCSEPPDGHQRWTLQLLVDELGRLQVVTSVCRETVRRCLKKIASNRGKAAASAFPRETALVSWPTWRKSSTSTVKRMTQSIR